MKNEGLENLIKQAESMESGQAEEKAKLDPDYQSAEDVREKCKERAIWIIGGFEAIIGKLKPEAAHLVLTDPMMNDGANKVAAVLEKYPGADVPPWLKRLMAYQEEFQCGMWFAGAFYGIYQADKSIQAEKEKQDQEQDQEQSDEIGRGDKHGA